MDYLEPIEAEDDAEDADLGIEDVVWILWDAVQKLRAEVERLKGRIDG